MPPVQPYIRCFADRELQRPDSVNALPGLLNLEPIYRTNSWVA